jgi:hypothetical protein
MAMQLHVIKRAAGVVSATVVAILGLAACGSDGGRTAEQPTSTAVESSDDRSDATSVTTTTAPRPDTIPTLSPSTSSPSTSSSSPSSTVPDDQEYETIATVVEQPDGPHLCFDMPDSSPPRCGAGLALVDWSWDAIGFEHVQDGTTLVDQVYVTGAYDPAAQTFTIDEARAITDADIARIRPSRPLPDYRVPCPPPDGGWPAVTNPWPGDEIAALDGYAGAWIDEGRPVWTVKFKGDLEPAKAAISEHYTDAVCVVGASHSAAELSAIAEQLQAMSSLQVLSTAPYVDASGEWIEAGVIAPDADRQSAFDDEFGPGVVRLVPFLAPVISP